MIAVAAAVALLIGGGAGYGAARLAQRAEPGPVPASTPTPAAPTGPTPDPTSDPSATGSREPVPPAPTELDTVAVAKRTLPGTVMIRAGRSTGSGFVLDTEGRIMTNNHVVAERRRSSTIRVIFSDGRRATRESGRPQSVLRSCGDQGRGGQSLKPMAIGDSDQTQVGSR